MDVSTILRASKLGLNRRTPAPHPGRLVAREFLDPLGLDPTKFANLIGMDATRLNAMLAGDASLDVDAAVRIGRSIGISVERLMNAQIRYDFGVVRDTEHLWPVPSPDVLADFPFPETALPGHLALTHDASDRAALFFVADGGTSDGEHDMSSVHPVRIGDTLRIYETDGRYAWAGPILRTLDGDPLFAFVSPNIWKAWFTANARADFARAN